jgi:hypothetical protein
MERFYDHLLPGGVLIVDGWLTKMQFKDGAVHIRVYKDKDIIISRLGYSKISGNVSKLEEHYLIGRRDNGIKHITDKHELGLFETNNFLSIMREVGFDAKVLKSAMMERSRYVGIKP